MNRQTRVIKISARRCHKTVNRPSDDKQLSWRSLNEDDDDTVGGADCSDVIRYGGDVDGDWWPRTSGRVDGMFDWHDEQPESSLVTGSTVAVLLSNRISMESSILFALSPCWPRTGDDDVSSIFFACNLPPQLSGITANELLAFSASSPGVWVTWLSGGFGTGNVDVLSKQLWIRFHFRRSVELVTAVWYSVRLLPRRRLPWRCLGNGWDDEYRGELTVLHESLKHSRSKCRD